MVSMEEFAAELRAFDARREVVNELRRELRKPAPEVRKAVRRSALATLPARGGLGAWVARARLTVLLKDAGRSAGVRLKLSRKNSKGKAELEKLDASGRIRHPLYGNRRKWYPQTVPARFFSAVWDVMGERFVKSADEAVDRAFDKIRRG